MQVRQRFWLLFIFSVVVMVLFLVGMGGVYLLNKSTKEKFDHINSVYVPVNNTISDIRHQLRELERKFDEVVHTNDPSAIEEAKPTVEKIEKALASITIALAEQTIVPDVIKAFIEYYTSTENLAKSMQTQKIEALQAQITESVSARRHFEQHLNEVESYLHQSYQKTVFETQRQLDDLTVILFVMMFVLTATLFTGSYIIMRRLSTRLNTLVSFAQEVESGNYEGTYTAHWNDEFSVVIRAFNAMVKSVKTSTDQLNRLASIDSLTEVSNRNALLQRLDVEIRSVRRHRYPLTFCMCDIDKFKTVNDSYGHLSGDELLRAFARCVRDLLRAEDIVGRYGGDEFGIILPHTTAEEAYRALERIRERFSTRVFLSDNHQEFSVTTSFGICEFQQDMTTDMLIRFADEALYESKRKGRNCSTVVKPVISSKTEADNPDDTNKSASAE